MSCIYTIPPYNTPIFNILPINLVGDAISITGADIYVNFKKPSMSDVITVSGTPYISGSYTYIQYTPNSGFIDTPGRWTLYGTIILGSQRYDTDETHFKVRRT